MMITFIFVLLTVVATSRIWSPSVKRRLAYQRYPTGIKSKDENYIRSSGGRPFTALATLIIKTESTH